jgi:hypothetical protein
LSGNPRWPIGNVTVKFLVYSAIPLLNVQDFARDLLVGPGAEDIMDETLRQQQSSLIETRH